MSNTDTTTIRLMWNTSAFADTTLPSNVTTIGHLKDHLGNVPANASVNYNGVVVTDDSKVLEDGAALAIVARDKTGG
jgi:hypothetical protein